MPWIVVCKEGPRGPKGERGDLRNEPVPTATPGEAGEHLIGPLAEVVALPSTPPVLWAISLVHSAELDLLNGAISTCTNKLDWLMQLRDWHQASTPPGEPNTLDFLVDKAKAIAALALAGRDPFGRDGSYVPLLRFDFLQDAIQPQIHNAKLMEDAVQALKAALAQKQNMRAAVEMAVKAADGGVEILRRRIIEFQRTATSLLDESATLRLTLDQQLETLLNASQAFQEAVSRKAGGGCSFKQVLAAAAMVTTVVATAGAGATLATSTVSVLQALARRPASPETNDPWYVNLVNDVKEIAKVVEPAGKSLESFQQAYGKAQKAIDEYEQLTARPDTPPQPSTDYAKILANKADFDREIEKFRNLPEALVYKREMDLFVATAETRNNKILEHDALVRLIWDHWGQIRTMQSEAAVFLADQTYDYSLDVAESALSAILDQTKWSLMRAISTLQRALEYLTGATSIVKYDDRNIGAVAGVLAQASSDYLEALERFGAGLEEARGLRIPWREILTEDAQTALLRGEPAYFNVPMDHAHFKLRAVVTLRRMYLVGGSVKGVRVQFEHQGRSPMLYPDGSLRVFTHVKIPRLYAVDDNGEVTDAGRFLSTEGDRTFAGVSPFGPWRVQLHGTEDARRQALESDLAFDVYSRTLSIKGMAALGLAVAEIG